MYKLDCRTAQSSFFVSVDYEIINQRCKHIHQENSEHDPFRVCRVKHPDEYCKYTYQNSIKPLPGFSVGGCYRIGCHKHGTKREATQNQVIMCRHLRERRCAYCIQE